MWIIIALIIFGAFMLVAELVFLPGISIAGLISLALNGGAAYLALMNYGVNGMILTIVIIIALSVVVTIYSLRYKTWHKLSLKSTIESTSQQMPQENNVKVGDRARTITRLAPMGKIMVDGQIFEAKSIDKFIDQQKEVEVIGFENYNVIVKLIK